MSLQEIWNLGEKKLNIFEDHKNDEKMKGLAHSWIERLNVINMLILPEFIYKFNMILIKIPHLFPSSC